MNRVSRAAHAGSGRVSALDHKARNDAVENQSVIKAVVDKLQKICDRFGSRLRIQFDFDLISVFHLQDYLRILFVCHIFSFAVSSQ